MSTALSEADASPGGETALPFAACLTTNGRRLVLAQRFRATAGRMNDRSQVIRKQIWEILVKVVASCLVAGVFYAAWLTLFLVGHGPGNRIVQAGLWLMAPVVTGAGFAAGVVLADRVRGSGKTGFLRVFVWPLVGCALGAVAVYWFGPMLVVFGMFVAGAVSVACREVVILLRQRGDGEIPPRWSG